MTKKSFKKSKEEIKGKYEKYKNIFN